MQRPHRLFELLAQCLVQFRVELGNQIGQGRTGQFRTVNPGVAAGVDVGHALAVVVMGVVGVVAEAVVLILVGIGFQGDFHALTGKLTQRQGAHAEEHFLDGGVRCFGEQLGAVVVFLAGCPLCNHPFEIGDQQIGRGIQVGGAAVAIAMGALLALGVVRRRTLSGAAIEAVQVLAPQQEFNSMVSGGHVGLRASDFVQLRQQVWCQAGSVDRRATNIDFRAGNNVCRSALVAQFVLVAVFLYVIDQAFVQRPGIQLPFPVINHGVTKAEHLSLLIGHPGSQPGLFCLLQIFFGRAFQEGVYCAVEGLCGGQCVFKVCMGQVGVVFHDIGFADGFCCRRLFGCRGCGCGFVAATAGRQ